jgi:hypothetical protein
MSATKNVRDLFFLSSGLSGLAIRMEPGKAADTLTQAMTTSKEGRAWYYLSLGLSAVAARMRPEKAAESCAQAAATLTPAMHWTNDQFALAQLPEGLSALLAGVDHSEQGRRALALTGAFGCAADGYAPLACLPLLRPALEPLPCRLSTPQLVELLKHPLFANEARRIVLDQLGNRYERRFADLWEFAAWVREHEPSLDLTTPLQLPRP